MLTTLCEAFAGLDHNVTWRDLVRGKGITPHQKVYRRAIAEVLDAEAAARIGDGPSFQVLIAHPILGRRTRLAGLLPAVLYEMELHLVSRPHLRWAQRAGLEARLVDARQAAREGRLAELVCAAATVPPLFDLPCWDGRPVLDAGMANQAPMPEPDEGRTLILLTRDYRNLPREPRKIYVWPSRETPADKLDFTDPSKLRRTWDLGARDARCVLARWAREDG